MSLGRRLYNVARAELHDAAKKLGRSDPEPVFDEERPSPPVEPPLVVPRESPEVQRYFANLELPVDASFDDVKHAYRRLMRQYHPDLHQGDPERAAAATKLSQQLRQAYDGLKAHFGRR